MRQHIGVTNPATAYCIAQGGVPYEEMGGMGVYEICQLPGGSSCPSWALFRGECFLEYADPDPEPEPSRFKWWHGVLLGGAALGAVCWVVKGTAT